MNQKSSQNNSWHAFVLTDKTFSDLQQAAAGDGLKHKAVSKCSIKESFQKINDIKAKVFFLEYQTGQDHLYQLFIQRAHHLDAKVALLADKKSMPDFNWLKQINVDMLETLPISSKHLKKSFLQLVNKKQKNDTTSAEIITFMKFKPNSGATTCALNTAALLAETAKVLIIDFDLYFSPIRKHFNLSLNSFLYELLEHPERIDKELIKASQLSISKNLKLLTATNDLNKTLKPAPEAVDFLLSYSAKMFDYIIISLPFDANMYNHPSLSLSDKVIGIVTANRASIESFLRFEPLLKENIMPNKLHLWLNQPTELADLEDEDFIQKLTIKISGKISYHPDLMLDAKDEFTSAIEINSHAKFISELKSLLSKAKIYQELQKSSFISLITSYYHKLMQQLKSGS